MFSFSHLKCLWLYLKIGNFHPLPPLPEMSPRALVVSACASWFTGALMLLVSLPGLLASTATAGGGDKWWRALLGRESEPQATWWLGESGSQAWLSLLLSSLWPQVPLELGGQSYTATQHNCPCCLQSLWCCGLSLHSQGTGIVVTTSIVSLVPLLLHVPVHPPLDATDVWNFPASWCVRLRKLC